MNPRAVAYAFTVLPSLIKSGIRPSPMEPLAWYDRAIRVVGGVLMLAVLILGLLVTLVDMFSH